MGKTSGENNHTPLKIRFLYANVKMESAVNIPLVLSHVLLVFHLHAMQLQEGQFQSVGERK